MPMCNDSITHLAMMQITDALQNDIIDAIANLMTEYCPIDCEACRMAS